MLRKPGAQGAGVGVLPTLNIQKNSTQLLLLMRHDLHPPLVAPTAAAWYPCIQLLLQQPCCGAAFAAGAWTLGWGGLFWHPS